VKAFNYGGDKLLWAQVMEIERMAGTICEERQEARAYPKLGDSREELVSDS
jgi:hypothetical protein